MSEYSTWLKKQLKIKGLSPEKLSSLAGLSNYTVRAIIKAGRWPRAATKTAIMGALANYKPIPAKEPDEKPIFKGEDRALAAALAELVKIRTTIDSTASPARKLRMARNAVNRAIKRINRFIA